VDITDRVNKKDVFALNADGAANLFLGGGHALSCKSDDGAQFVVHLPLLETCKVFALVLTAPPGDEPTTCKVFLNRVAFDFSDVEDEPAFTLALKPAEFGKEQRTLYRKCMAVNCLDLVFDKAGAERSALSSITLIGQPVMVADVRNIKKDEHEH